MGGLLDKPITDVDVEDDVEFVEDPLRGIRYGSASMQGWRPRMEDAHTGKIGLDPDNGVSFFGVYDGHGGAQVSKFCSKHLHNCLLERSAYRKQDYAVALFESFLATDQMVISDQGRYEMLLGMQSDAENDGESLLQNEAPPPAPPPTSCSDGNLSLVSANNSDNKRKANKETMGNDSNAETNSGSDSPKKSKVDTSNDGTKNVVDRDIRAKWHVPWRGPGVGSGTTSVVAMLKRVEQREYKIYIGNAGDSRAVLCRGGKAIALSKDHVPSLPSEKQRILAAGGYVSSPGNRICGNLNLSRAIGDFAYKRQVDQPMEEQMITSAPEVWEFTTTPEDEFLILACDGIWDCMTNQGAVDYIRSRLVSLDETARRAVRISDIAKSLVQDCLADGECDEGTDNFTLVIIELPSKGGSPKLHSGEITKYYTEP